MVMRQMRENTKWIMLITALAFVGLMVFEWGMDLSGRSGAELQGGEIGTIDGEPVTSEEYNRVYRNLYDQQQQAQTEPLTSTQIREIEDAAWDQLVQDRLVQRELDRLGIAVTDEEIRSAALNAPPPTFQEAPAFQTNGQFDIEKYRQFLAQSADPQLLQQLEAYYRELIPRNRLLQRVAAGVYVPDSELWRIYRDRNETATVRYLMLEPERLVPDAAISVSEQEIQAYYESHQEDFRQPASAQVRYVTLDMRPGPQDTAAALQRARELREEVTTGGADFGEVASTESSDAASAAQGGSLGTITRGQTVSAFEQAAFAATVGQVTEPVLSPFGYHLIRVSERTDSTVTASHILVPIELTRDNEDRLLSRADTLEDVAESQSLEQAASELGLQVREASIAEERPFLPGVSDASEGASWAFLEAEPGMPSPLFEAGQNFYILELVERQPERIVPLADATEAIRARVRTQKKLERAREIGRDIVDRLRQGMDMQAIAEQQGLEVRNAGPFTRVDFVPGIGRTNAVIGAAFGLQPDRYSNLTEANERLFVLQLVEKTEASREEFEQNKEQLRAALTSNLEEIRIRQYLRELRESADVQDLRREAAAAARTAAAQPQPGLF